MSMIEIDRKLFVTCRLCLEDSGTYQIIPAVQEQIAYCFGIVVEPFDGLPQLICKKCQSLLVYFSESKRSFVEKQDDLKKKRLENNLEKTPVKTETSPQIDTVKTKKNKRKRLSSSSDDSNENNETSPQIDTVKTKKNKRKRLSSLSDDLNKNNETESEDVVKNPPKIVKTSPKTVTNSPRSVITEKEEGWKAKYQKTFQCRLCNTSWTSWKSASNHISTHKGLKCKYEHIFNKFCLVELPKIDNKPNLTGSVDQVVYSNTKIIAKGTTDYCISYKYSQENSSSDDESIRLDDYNNADECTDSSSRSNIKARRRKRAGRICSRSSNETVVLENSSKGSKTSKYGDCINIDDSESSEENEDFNKERQKVLTKIPNVDTTRATAVAKLISISHQKYVKKHEQPDNHSLQQLNRKILSIGRQIINKRGSNSIGNRLIKYIDHLNLNIIWISRPPLTVTSCSHYYKIIPRTRYPSEKPINDFDGYKKKYKKPNIPIIENNNREQELVEENDVVGTLGMTDAKCVESIEVEVPGIGQEISKGNEAQQYLVPINAQKATVTFIQNDDGYAELDNALNCKILNKNPVANPKQLKKFTNDTKKDKSKLHANSTITLEVNPDELSSDVITNCDNNMPIITFTTSLALPQANGNSNNSSVESSIATSSVEKPKPSAAPRIKVKSATELMSKETLNRMGEAYRAQNLQTIPNGAGLAQYAPGSAQSATSSSPHDSYADDYVILDTMELPNTKTSSPFGYFRMLLQVHNLSLLDTEAVVSPDFKTLIRFKVLYKQENKDLPVVLCLSLLCHKHFFCLKIKDRNSDNINLSKISANWQWEILKIYKGDVVSKVLQNAEKISPEVHINTNRFLCLLKSITLVPRA